MEHTHIENVKNFSTENSRVLTSDYVNKLNAIYCMQIILNEIYNLWSIKETWNTRTDRQNVMEVTGKGTISNRSLKI